jgi:hypothetical protein
MCLGTIEHISRAKLRLFKRDQLFGGFKAIASLCRQVDPHSMMDPLNRLPFSIDSLSCLL